MFAVIFEVKPKAEGKEEYLIKATNLRKFLKKQEGFISIERFQSLADEDKVLSLSFWENEKAIEKWRNIHEHRMGQQEGKEKLKDRTVVDYRQVVGFYLKDWLELPVVSVTKKMMEERFILIRENGVCRGRPTL